MTHITPYHMTHHTHGVSYSHTLTPARAADVVMVTRMYDHQAAGSADAFVRVDYEYVADAAAAAAAAGALCALLCQCD